MLFNNITKKVSGGLVDWTADNLHASPAYLRLEQYVNEQPDQTFEYVDYSAPATLKAFANGITDLNGNIIFIPNNASKVGLFDAQTKTTSLVGPNFGTQSSKFRGGVLLQSGKVLLIPHSYSNFVILDTSDPTNVYMEDSIFFSSATSKFGAGTLGPDGKVYLIPQNMSQVHVFDPDTLSIESFGDTYSGTNKWHSGALAPNGLIYCAPQNASAILVIDPINRTTRLISTGLTKGEYIGAILAANNKVYFTPYGTGSGGLTMELDPTSESIDFIGPSFSTNSNRFVGSVLTPSGLVVCAPAAGNHALVIDPEQRTQALVNIAANGSFSGLALTFDGQVVFVPFREQRVTEMMSATSEALDPNFVLSRFYNKY